MFRFPCFFCCFVSCCVCGWCCWFCSLASLVPVLVFACAFGRGVSVAASSFGLSGSAFLASLVPGSAAAASAGFSVSGGFAVSVPGGAVFPLAPCPGCGGLSSCSCSPSCSCSSCAPPRPFVGRPAPWSPPLLLPAVAGPSSPPSCSACGRLGWPLSPAGLCWPCSPLPAAPPAATPAAPAAPPAAPGARPACGRSGPGPCPWPCAPPCAAASAPPSPSAPVAAPPSGGAAAPAPPAFFSPPVFRCRCPSCGAWARVLRSGASRPWAWCSACGGGCFPAPARSSWLGAVPLSLFPSLA